MLANLLLLAVSTLSAESRIAIRLAADGGLPSSQWSSLDAGRVVSRTLDTPDRAEVVSLAAVRVRATRERFLACARDPGCLRPSEDALGGGLMGESPSPADLQALTLDAKDLGYLRACRPGDCDVRLDAEAISRFQREMDWSATGSAAAATALFRQVLAERAAGYAARGAASLPGYDDNDASVSVADTLRTLLGRRFVPMDAFPELGARMAEEPFAVSGSDEYLYWYKERFWRKSLVALCHASLLTGGDAVTDLAVVVSRQVYASHYYDGAVDLVLFEAPAGSDRGLLVFSSRARADVRPSGFTWLERLLINRLVRRRLEGQLRGMRERMERGEDSRLSAGTRTPAGPGSPEESRRR